MYWKFVVHTLHRKSTFSLEKKKQIEMEKAHKKIAHFISWSFGGVIEWFERRHKELTTYFLVYFRFALHFPPLCLASFVPLEAHNKKFVWNFFQTDGFGIFPFFSFQSRERTKAWQNCFKSVTCHDRMNWLSASWYFYLTLCVVFFFGAKLLLRLNCRMCACFFSSLPSVGTKIVFTAMSNLQAKGRNSS